MAKVKESNNLTATKEEFKKSAKVNREHKDRLFKFIFGNNEHKEWTLSLYNAVNGSDYTDSDEIEFNTIENVVYMSMKNDLSFLVGNSISLYEQQSKYNPNMPIRFLIYSGMVYAKHISNSDDFYLFSSVQQKAPAPKCVCFYNGRDNKEDKIVLKLSDVFENPEESDIEVTVTMLNINYGHNKKMLNACQPLKEYSMLVDNIRKYEKEYTLEEAVDNAIDDLPENAVIKPFLLSNKAEVKRMCITEYDEEKTLAFERREGEKTGRIEGEKIGRIEGEKIGRIEGAENERNEIIIRMLSKGKSVEEIADLIGCSVEDVELAKDKLD